MVAKKVTKKKTTRKAKRLPQIVPNTYIDVEYWSKVFRVDEITKGIKGLGILGLIFGVSFAVTLGILYLRLF